MQILGSLGEFRKILADAPEPHREKIISNCFVSPNAFPTLPQDPFSSAYFTSIRNLYADITGRTDYRPERDEKTPLDVSDFAVRPTIYRQDGANLARYLLTFGHLVGLLDVMPGMRVLEYGSGDGQLAIHLARLGCEVTVIDVEPAFLSVIKTQADAIGVPITTVQGTFETNPGRFDRVMYFESFHHCLAHASVISMLQDVVADDGLVLFGGEPIIAADNYWYRSVPYPWGPRLDGGALRDMMLHGWMELGFQESYFIELLNRGGWSVQRHAPPSGALGDAYTARKVAGAHSRAPRFDRRT